MKKRILIVAEDKSILEEMRQKLEGETDLVTVTAVSCDAGIELALQLKRISSCLMLVWQDCPTMQSADDYGETGRLMRFHYSCCLMPLVLEERRLRGRWVPMTMC